MLRFCFLFLILNGCCFSILRSSRVVEGGKGRWSYNPYDRVTIVDPGMCTPISKSSVGFVKKNESPVVVVTQSYEELLSAMRSCTPPPDRDAEISKLSTQREVGIFCFSKEPLAEKVHYLWKYPEQITYDDLVETLRLVSELDLQAFHAARKILFFELIDAILKRSSKVVEKIPENKKTELLESNFLKMYYFFCATQSSLFRVPCDFDMREYLKANSKYENLYYYWNNCGTLVDRNNHVFVTVNVVPDETFCLNLLHLLNQLLVLEQQVVWN
ncbi:hypothetical protein HYV11_03075 [Candidatus Dependentiae bacterium]|nr:hypothetical protein [Candidatus Dependentiae bacterium]